jgi:hypothetical protein
MKNWRPIMFFFLFILFLSFDLSAKESLLELKQELETYQLNPNPRQKSVIFELVREGERKHELKVDWANLNLLYQKNLNTTQSQSLEATLADLKNQAQEAFEGKQNPQIVSNGSQVIVVLVGLFLLSLVPYVFKTKSKKSIQAHRVLSKRTKPLSLELKGLAFVLNHKGQLVEMSEEATNFFPQVDKDNFSTFFKTHLLYINIKSANNLVKLRNIKELEHKLYYYKSKTLEYSGKNFRLIKLVEVRDLGLDLDNSASPS